MPFQSIFPASAGRLVVVWLGPFLGQIWRFLILILAVLNIAHDPGGSRVNCRFLHLWFDACPNFHSRIQPYMSSDGVSPLDSLRCLVKDWWIEPVNISAGSFMPRDRLFGNDPFNMD